MPALQKTKLPPPGFYVQKHLDSEDVVYISTDNKVYLYLSRVKRLEEGGISFEKFIYLWKSGIFSLFPISDKKFTDELQYLIKDIDPVGYRRLGMRLVKNPRIRRKNTHKISKNVRKNPAK